MRIQFEQARRLRRRVAKLESQLHRVELRGWPREQQVTVAHSMQGAGATESTADLVTPDRLSDMVNHDQRGAGSFAQPQQTLTQRGHGTRIVFVLIMRGIQRVQNDDLGRSRTCGR